MKTISKDNDEHSQAQGSIDVEKQEITEHQWDLWVTVSLTLHYSLPVGS
jgi:hypothetical protein